MRQNAANESLPFRGPRKIFDFWGWILGDLEDLTFVTFATFAT